MNPFSRAVACAIATSLSLCVTAQQLPPTGNFGALLFTESTGAATADVLQMINPLAMPAGVSSTGTIPPLSLGVGVPGGAPLGALQVARTLNRRALFGAEEPALLTVFPNGSLLPVVFVPTVDAATNNAFVSWVDFANGAPRVGAVPLGAAAGPYDLAFSNIAQTIYATSTQPNGNLTVHEINVPQNAAQVPAVTGVFNAATTASPFATRLTVDPLTNGVCVPLVASVAVLTPASGALLANPVNVPAPPLAGLVGTNVSTGFSGQPGAPNSLNLIFGTRSGQAFGVVPTFGFVAFSASNAPGTPAPSTYSSFLDTVVATAPVVLTATGLNYPPAAPPSLAVLGGPVASVHLAPGFHEIPVTQGAAGPEATLLLADVTSSIAGFPTNPNLGYVMTVTNPTGFAAVIAPAFRNPAINGAIAMPFGNPTVLADGTSVSMLLTGGTQGAPSGGVAVATTAASGGIPAGLLMTFQAIAPISLSSCDRPLGMSNTGTLDFVVNCDGGAAFDVEQRFVVLAPGNILNVATTARGDATSLGSVFGPAGVGPAIPVSCQGFVATDSLTSPLLGVPGVATLLPDAVVPADIAIPAVGGVSFATLPNPLVVFQLGARRCQFSYLGSSANAVTVFPRLVTGVANNGLPFRAAIDVQIFLGGVNTAVNSFLSNGVLTSEVAVF